ncbi:MBL fold metallo-hydrolase [Roseateles violae]|uniref:MBL fold metallo-hydrolase n=1 Tax=Roseateles violae TaxID=3058042 RepID=A0ABT8DPX9_9BURK|nr:MBL fold metallo-hydrolase [Pelomonas sp. PFR6]MDN3918994.1 MBL fold metallo-hydrolase [Pelomonas sp. PFR6]
MSHLIESLARRLQALLLVASLLAGAPLAAQPALLKPQRLSEHVWLLEGQSALGSRENRNYISNAGLIIGPEGVVLVDALGSPALARELLALIKTMSDKPLTHVILTHYHADHVYGLQVLKAAGATIVAHQAAREYLQSDTAAQRLQASKEQGLVETQTRLVPADRWIDGDTPLRAAGLDLQLMPVGPAHTPEDLAIWLASDKLIFAGDLVFRGRVPFVGQADSRRWIASLDRLLTRPAAIVVPGHGPASTDALQDLLLTRDYLAYLRATMGRAAREMTPFDEAYAATDWSRYEALPLFKVANRMNAYNTYLLMEQEKP